MAGSIPDEDESLLDITQQTRRPLDTAYRQQRVRSWNPYLDPIWVIGAFVLLACIFLPVGYKIQSMSDSVVELSVTYDDYSDASAVCSITKANENRLCNITLTATDDMDPPILIYYEIDNFHQNHRGYKESLDLEQLKGTTNPAKPSALCDPLRRVGGITLNPCGLIANTLFNDVITLANTSTASDGVTPLAMIETGIAWQSDIEFLYGQPSGFLAEPCPGACDETCCQGTTSEGNTWSCVGQLPYIDADGECFRYFYPDENTTQYLYETYPKIVSPIEGVLNEHFIVWMRVAAQPTFRKLYGWIDQPIAKGTELQFGIDANWEVASFDGSKTLVVSTTNAFGGENRWLSLYFIVFGYFCLAVVVLFGSKHIIKPRKVADKRYLRFKQD